MFKKLCFILLSTLAVVSCQKNNLDSNDSNGSTDQERLITLNVGSSATTRGANEGIRVKFESGDQISVSAYYADNVAANPDVAQSNIIDLYQDAYFENSPAAFFADNATDPNISVFDWGLDASGGPNNQFYPTSPTRIFFTGYYPFAASVPEVLTYNEYTSAPTVADTPTNPSLTINLLDDASAENAEFEAPYFAQPDVLWHLSEIPSRRDSVSGVLSFKHVLAQVAFQVQTDVGIDEHKFEKLVFKTVKTANFDLFTGDYTFEDAPDYVEAVYTMTLPSTATAADSIIPLKDNSPTFKPLDIVNPNGLDDFNYPMVLPITSEMLSKGELEVHTNVRVYTIRLSEYAAFLQDFEAGKKNTITLTVTSTAVVLDADILPWGSGDTDDGTVVQAPETSFIFATNGIDVSLVDKLIVTTDYEGVFEIEGPGFINNSTAAAGDFEFDYSAANRFPSDNGYRIISIEFYQGDTPIATTESTYKSARVYSDPIIDLGDLTLMVPIKKWLLSEITSTNYPEGTDWTIEADTEAPALADFDSLRFVLDKRNGIITADSSINLTLTKATAIPDGVVYLSGAFNNCNTLKSLSLPDATSIGHNAMYGSWYITEVNAPNVSKIGEYTFQSCRFLNSLTLDFENITEIPDGAFAGCGALTEFNLPNVTTIGSSTFISCSTLNSLTLDFDNITEIPSYAFFGCEALTELNFPNVTEIGYKTFGECYKLSTIILGDITYIPSQAFEYCTSLTSLDFPKVDSVGSFAFQNSTKLTSISLGKTIGISHRAFQGCEALITMNIGTELTTAPTAEDIKIENVAFHGAPAVNITLTVGYGTGTGDIGDMTWTAEAGSAFGGFKEVIAPAKKWLLSEITSTNYPEGTEWTIEADTETPTLANFDSLNHVLRNVIATDGSINLTLTKATTIPDGASLYPFSTGAFYDCDALKSVSIPDAESVGENSFYGASYITSIDLPNTTSLGESVFSNCQKLEGVTLGEVLELPDRAFFYCNSIKELILPTVTKIGTSAFQHCWVMTTLELGPITAIAEGAIFRCDSLTTIDFPTVTKIENSGISSCAELHTVNLPLVDSIEGNAIISCPKLVNLTLAFDKITEIPRNAFLECSALTALDFPEVDSVAYQAFKDCTSLESLTLGKATKIDQNAFYNCTALTTLNIGTGLTTAPSEEDIIIASGIFTGAPVGNITLTVGYGTASGTSPNMTWTPETGSSYAGFNSVVVDTNY